MKTVENGDIVKLCYTGKLDNGIIFDKTDNCKPVETRVGNGNLVQGFENAIIGMVENERRSFVLDPDEAYGERDEKLVRSFAVSELPIDFEPAVGQVVVFMTETGQRLPAIIKYVDEAVFVADFNHPLAGRSLEFEVEVAGIGEALSDAPERCGAECCCA